MERWSAAALHASRVRPCERPYERTAPTGISRGQLLRRGAGVAGGVAGIGLLGPAAAFAKPKNADPNPVPGGFNDTFTGFVPSDPLIHVFPPAVPFEMSTITDFNGTIAAGEVQGTAHGSDGTTYGFDCDMRFMDGTYVAVDGRVHHGTFGFV
jgi:hypothetical protein